MIPALSFTAGSNADDLRGVKRTALDAYQNLYKLYNYLRQFSQVEIVTANGKKMTVLAFNVGSAEVTSDAHKWFAVTNISTEEDFKVRVNPGRFTAPNVAGIGSDPPTIATLTKDYTVLGGDFTVTDGSKVYLRLTATETPFSKDYSNETATTDPTSTPVNPEAGGNYPVPELITVQYTQKAKVWAATGGAVIVQTTTPEDTLTTSHILLAEIVITDGIMTIKQRRDGGVDTSAVTGVHGSDVLVDANTEDHEVCVTDGNGNKQAHDVTFIAKTNPD